MIDKNLVHAISDGKDLDCGSAELSVNLVLTRGHGSLLLDLYYDLYYFPAANHPSAMALVSPDMLAPLPPRSECGAGRYRDALNRDGTRLFRDWDYSWRRQQQRITTLASTVKQPRTLFSSSPPCPSPKVIKSFHL
jgi:hypothetical protein